jgi:hypothetical protein
MLTSPKLKNLPVPVPVLVNFVKKETSYRPYIQGCGAGTGTGSRTGTDQNSIHMGTPEPEPYSEYGYGSGYKEMKQTTQKNLTKSFMISFSCRFR